MSEAGDDAVLIVEDDETQRAMMLRLLSQEYRCAAAVNADEARARLAGGDFSLVLCDINMPGGDGLSLAREIGQLYPHVAVTMVTGFDVPAIAQEAFEVGALDYVVKPFRPSELRISVMNALRRRRVEIELDRYVSGLESDLIANARELNRTLADLQESRAQLEQSRLDVVQRLSLAVEARDRVTAEHINGMVAIVARLAKASGFADIDADALGIASSMHDVGKIGVPDEILLKPGPLDTAERSRMQQHCRIGYEILAGSPNRLLELGASVALAHHERFDGDGYPNRLSGADIPLEARVVQIVDVYSALTTDRPYRPAMPVETALGMISDGAATQFDPELTALFLDRFDEIAGAGVFTDSAG